MALVALTTASKVEIVGFPVLQLTLPTGEAITPGAPVRIDASGLFVNGNGTVVGEAAIYGIAVGQAIVAAGMPLTAVRIGRLDGFDFTAQAYGALIYVSDTDARLGDVAGTVARTAGRVVPATASLPGVAFDKILEVDIV
jgi:hypothetical protein